jgi:hypothetical protein
MKKQKMVVKKNKYANRLRTKNLILDIVKFTERKKLHICSNLAGMLYM